MHDLYIEYLKLQGISLAYQDLARKGGTQGVYPEKSMERVADMIRKQLLVVENEVRRCGGDAVPQLRQLWDDMRYKGGK